MSQKLSDAIITECKRRLLQTKSDLLMRAQTIKTEFNSHDPRGDEADQSAFALAENQFLVAQSRLRHQIMEIEFALARIHSGEYGICEETQEPIEQERLLAIPWTRLSVEGAEMRESIKRRYAK